MRKEFWNRGVSSKRAILCVFAVSLFVGAGILAACSSNSEHLQEPDYAGPTVESALRSLSDGDYSAYESLLTEASRSLLTEVAFQQVHQLITGKVGTYIDKSFVEVTDEGGYLTVYYEAKFTDETSDVSVKAVFREENGEIKLAGFHLDSPKLRS